MTSSDPAERLRIGKIWKSNGKWPVTDGVKQDAYVFERAHYPDLEAFSVDLDARRRDGVFALVPGRLKQLPELDPLQAVPRRRLNFVDDPSWLFQLDFDGLEAANAGRIDRPRISAPFHSAKPASGCRRRLKTSTASSTRPARAACLSTRRASRPTVAPNSVWCSCCRVR